MIFIIGATLSFFLAIILLGKKKKSTADIILFLWMIVSTLDLGFAYIRFQGLIFEYMGLAGFLMAIPLLYGPLLYFYTKAVFNMMPRKKWTIGIHLVPIVCLYLYNAPFYFQAKPDKIAFIQNIIEQNNMVYELVNILQMIFGVVYTIASFKLVQRFKSKIPMSSIEKANVSWINKLILGFFVIWTVVILADVFASHLPTQMIFIIYFSVSLFVLMTGFFGIKHGGVFAEMLSHVTNKTDKPIDRYQKSGLTVTEKIKLRTLLQVQIEERIYYRSDLSLAFLAKKIGTSPNYLSQLINEDYDKNFHGYINSYRIAAFKEMVKNDRMKNYSIQALSEECGFGSKASFNKYFKLEMEMTPSEYMRGQKKS